MALEGKKGTKTEGDKSIETFIAEFTNGTIKQLEELATFLENEGFTLPTEREERMKEVVRIGISWLETLKEQKSQEEKTSK